MGAELAPTALRALMLPIWLAAARPVGEEVARTPPQTPVAAIIVRTAAQLRALQPPQLAAGLLQLVHVERVRRRRRFHLHLARQLIETLSVCVDISRDFCLSSVLLPLAPPTLACGAVPVPGPMAEQGPRKTVRIATHLIRLPVLKRTKTLWTGPLRTARGGKCPQHPELTKQEAHDGDQEDGCDADAGGAANAHRNNIGHPV